MYVSDLTRVIFVDSIPADIGALYCIVLEAQQRAIAKMKPGVVLRDVDRVARDVISGAGYGEQFNHRLGHSLGLDVHEPPTIGWDCDLTLEPGMVLTVEPGIYVPGLGGVRIEDDVLITDKGARVLSRLDKSLEGAVIRI